MNEHRKKVILDVDTGTDDALAILMALTDPGLEVIGITVTQGNQPLENCVDNTLRVVDLLGADVPVYAGCSAPMVRSLSKGRMAQNPENVVSAEVDGKPVILHPPHLDLPAPHSKPQQMHACSYLVETLRRSEEKVTIIPVGPPTNVGMAFRMAPDLKDHVEEVVFMGGAVDRGNITPVGEANFVHDPEAAKIVLDSGVDCRVITLNATHSAEMTRADADKILALGTPAAKFVGDLMKTASRWASRWAGRKRAKRPATPSTTPWLWPPSSTPASSPTCAGRSATWTLPAAPPTASWWWNTAMKTTSRSTPGSPTGPTNPSSSRCSTGMSRRRAACK